MPPVKESSGEEKEPEVSSMFRACSGLYWFTGGPQTHCPDTNSSILDLIVQSIHKINCHRELAWEIPCSHTSALVLYRLEN